MADARMVEEFLASGGRRAEPKKAKRRKALPHASEKQQVLNERWAFIRSCFLLCQLRTDGYYSCHECGAKFDGTSELDLHHIVRRSKGGDYTPANAMLLCRPCHQRADGNELHFSGGENRG